ncbi:glycosyltransferase [Yersinia enterocolitica]|uniref:glycosyltransferase n=1 Tax=Yersinia enterocolitica TaxID=630 RepID=UPI002AC62D56|nr:glycosyltransferase [Yersinia enterocolitica]
MSKLHWSIDYFVQQNGTIFSYGWIFHEDKSITKLCLSLPESDTDNVLKIDYGKCRDDVGAYFSSFEQAKHSGYIIYGSFGSEAKIVDLKLLCTYSDGSTESVDIPNSCLNVAIDVDSGGATSKKLIFKQFMVLLKRAFMLIKSGKFSLLYEKFSRYKNKTPSSNLDSAEDIFAFLNPAEREQVIFLIDHDLGGGVNHYRNRLIQEKMSAGYSALVLSFDITTLSYKLIVRGEKGEFKFKIPGYKFIYDLLAFVKIKEIVYNTGVSFTSPEEIPGFLIGLKMKTNAQLMTQAHDLFPLCPSHFLINDQGKYCDIPEPSVCASCLRNNTFGFTTLFESNDIEEWRDKWGGLMIASDKIVTFSQNTLDLYRRVYPQIQEENAVVIPHTVDYLPAKANIQQTQQLKIGVVGIIGYHKGAKIVKELAQEIKDKQCPAEIVIIGTVVSSCPADIVTQTGAYKHEELPSLLEKHGVNIILFPSIWPETFSYVVQEMMELGYPVASFDLGAPAERLRTYQDGLVLSSMSAGIVLQELVKFHRQVYSIQ